MYEEPVSLNPLETSWVDPRRKVPAMETSSMRRRSTEVRILRTDVGYRSAA